MRIITKILIALGILSSFHGTTDHFQAYAKESSSNAGAASACDTMGGRSGGCGKSGS